MLKPKNLFYESYLMASTALLIFLIEMGVMGVDSVTGGKLPVLVHVNYPPNPKDVLISPLTGPGCPMGSGAGPAGRRSPSIDDGCAAGGSAASTLATLAA